MHTTLAVLATEVILGRQLEQYYHKIVQNVTLCDKISLMIHQFLRNNLLLLWK